MFYLALATLCSATIALIFKYTETHATNRNVITTANYFIAFVTGLVLVWHQQLLAPLTPLPNHLSFFQEVLLVLASPGDQLSSINSRLWAVSIGSTAGVFFFLSFLFYQKSVRENGVSLSGTFAKLGILIPMIFSIILWRELPAFHQWVGIFLSLFSIVMVNMTFGNQKKFKLRPALILLFFFGGIAEFSNKIYQQYGVGDYKDLFLLCVFFVAFLISLSYTIHQRSKATKRDILTGFAVGIPNLFSSYFLILSLATVKTSVAFPLYSAGSILLITIGGRVIFGEAISAKNKLAIALTVIALILVNLP